MKLTFLKPRQGGLRHPDRPQDGWTVDVHDSAGQLLARFFGKSEREVTCRAAQFYTATVTTGHDVEVKS